jgi:hypothetical protein
MLKTLIVEIYPGDVCLSFSRNIEEMQKTARYRLNLMSIAGSGNSKEFCRYFGITHHTTELMEDLITRLHYKTIQNAKDPQSLLYVSYVKPFKNWLGVVQDTIKRAIDNIKPERIYTSFGIISIDHFLTRLAVDRVFDGEIVYFAEAPVQFKKYGQAMIKQTKARVLDKKVLSSMSIARKFQIYDECYHNKIVDKNCYHGGCEIQLADEKLSNYD